MATTLQLRRGTAAEAAAFTGAQGEIFVDTDNNIAYIHDGSTQGGHTMGASDFAPDVAAVITNITFVPGSSGGEPTLTSWYGASNFGQVCYWNGETTYLTMYLSSSNEELFPAVGETITFYSIEDSTISYELTVVTNELLENDIAYYKIELSGASIEGEEGTTYYAQLAFRYCCSVDEEKTITATVSSGTSDRYTHEFDVEIGQNKYINTSTGQLFEFTSNTSSFDASTAQCEIGDEFIPYVIELPTGGAGIKLPAYSHFTNNDGTSITVQKQYKEGNYIVNYVGDLTPIGEVTAVEKVGPFSGPTYMAINVHQVDINQSTDWAVSANTYRNFIKLTIATSDIEALQTIIEGLEQGAPLHLYFGDNAVRYGGPSYVTKQYSSLVFDWETELSAADANGAGFICNPLDNGDGTSTFYFCPNYGYSGTSTGPYESGTFYETPFTVETYSNESDLPSNYTKITLSNKYDLLTLPSAYNLLFSDGKEIITTMVPGSLKQETESNTFYLTANMVNIVKVGQKLQLLTVENGLRATLDVWQTYDGSDFTLKQQYLNSNNQLVMDASAFTNIKDSRIQNPINGFLTMSPYSEWVYTDDAVRSNHDFWTWAQSHSYRDNLLLGNTGFQNHIYRNKQFSNFLSNNFIGVNSGIFLYNTGADYSEQQVWGNTIIGRYGLNIGTVASAGNIMANVVIGEGAGQNSTIGGWTNSVLIGPYALSQAKATDGSTASSVVAIGDNAGSGLSATYLNNSTFLGGYAGYGSSYGRYVTCVGSNAQVTGNYQLQLGDTSTNVYAQSAVNVRSDERDKADIIDTTLGLDFINALRPVEYKWDMRSDYFVEEEVEETITRTEKVREKNPAWSDSMPEYAKAEIEEYIIVDKVVEETVTRLVRTPIEKDGSKKRSRAHQGLIAQEVKMVMDAQGVDFAGYQDHSINGGDDVLTLRYEEFIAPMLKAIQELSAQNEALKDRIAVLEA